MMRYITRPLTWSELWSCLPGYFIVYWGTAVISHHLFRLSDARAFDLLIQHGDGMAVMALYMLAGLPILLARLCGKVSLLGTALVCFSVILLREFTTLHVTEARSPIEFTDILLRQLETHHRLYSGTALLSIALMYGVAVVIRCGYAVKHLAAPVVFFCMGLLWMATYPNLGRALQDAAYQGDAKEVGRLIDQGVDASLPPYPGDIPPLTVAWELGFGREPALVVPIINVLLQAGVAPDSVRDIEGRTPLLELMVWIPHSDLILQLVKAGADIYAHDYKRRLTPMYFVMNRGRIELARAMLREQPYIHAYHGHVWTLLHEMAAEGRLEFAKVLLEAGTDVNARERKTRATPLHWAALHGHPEMIALLRDYGADMDACNNDGMTALQVAMQRDHVSTVQALLDAGSRLPLQTGEAGAIESFFAEPGNPALRELGSRLAVEHPGYPLVLPCPAPPLASAESARVSWS